MTSQFSWLRIKTPKDSRIVSKSNSNFFHRFIYIKQHTTVTLKRNEFSLFLCNVPYSYSTKAVQEMIQHALECSTVTLTFKVLKVEIKVHKLPKKSTSVNPRFAIVSLVAENASDLQVEEVDQGVCAFLENLRTIALDETEFLKPPHISREFQYSLTPTVVDTASAKESIDSYLAEFDEFVAKHNVYDEEHRAKMEEGGFTMVTK